MLVRHGVQLSPLLADLFDMIERSGSDGILCEVLVGVFYPGRPRDQARRCIVVNIHHLNDKLIETDLEIRSHVKSGPYRVQRRRQRWWMS
jgi:hypothetical protein